MSQPLKNYPIFVIGTLFSTTLLAQTSSVNIYGLMDLGYRYTSNTDSGTENSKWSMVNGSRTASRLGFRGTEAINDDLSAIFTLEMAVAPDEGTTGDGTRQFNRLSFVGFKSQSLGQLTFGRQYSMTHEFLAFNGIDALDVANYSEWCYYVGTQYTPRYDNSVRYTNKFGNFVVSAMGVLDDAQTKGSYPWGATVVYKGVNWQFGGAYQQEKPSVATSNKTNETYTIGGSYQVLESLKLAGFYMNHRNKVTDKKDQTYSAGFVYQAAANVKLLGEYLHTKSSVAGSDGKRNAGILTAEYYMSKRTQPYIGVDYTKFSGSSIPASNKNDRIGLSIGMRHYF